MAEAIAVDEDTYTEAISFIIERDFFPSQAKVKALQRLAEAERSGLPDQVKFAARAIRNLNEPNLGPSGDNAKGIINYYNGEAPDLADRVNINLSLDQFQALYTSEDNASFAELLEKANAKRKEKFQWMFDKDRSQLLIENEDKKLIEAPRGEYRYKTKNALMYIPEGTGGSLIKENARAAPKAIHYTNTDLPLEASSLPQAKDTNLSLNQAGQAAGDETFRGYDLVESTPVIAPSEMGTPIMTWGEIEGTPMAIHGSQTPGPRFSMQNPSKREQLSMRLSEKASRSHRKRQTERSVTGTPRAGAGLMSPAVQHLLKKNATPRASSFSDALRSAYETPTPRRVTGSRMKGTPTPLFRAGATPSSFTPSEKKQR
ncbi:nuclear protein DGCR14 [Syncephalastrum racemosum]|uniref:Nuclear protein DGCR14 n=1 Tax=Syncephalastrum racemosum TaxID=13706 RepID=A0A1X2HD39_SYNRA|nr:nuclear protein DGCR14 [Syncephalastrum racemosum]